MDTNGKKIILASNSPRRKELMAGLGIDFISDTDTSFVETYSPDTPHTKVPELMSEGKSHGFHRPLGPDEILVTSDTMVLCGMEILGKPADKNDAIRMLKLLSGREHQVSSFVLFKELSDKEIEYYIDNYHPFDKAGAYGVQEWIGYVGITSIDGSFYNVMGFPTQRFYDELQDFLV